LRKETKKYQSIFIELQRRAFHKQSLQPLQCLILTLIGDAINPNYIYHSLQHFKFSDLILVKLGLYLGYVKQIPTCLEECPSSSVLKQTSQDVVAIW